MVRFEVEQVNTVFQRTGDIAGPLLREPFLYTAFVNNRTVIQGTIAELWNRIASTLNISYIVAYDTAGDYGHQGPNGTWSGAAGVLERKEVDLMLGYFAPKYPCASGVAFTAGFSYSPIVILSGIPLEKIIIDFRTIFNFQTEIYIIIPIVLVVVSAVKYISGYNRETKASFHETLWSFSGTLLGKGISSRIVTANHQLLSYFWWFFACNLTISISANLNSKFSTRISKPINNFDDVTRNPDVIPIIADSSYLGILLSVSSDGLYQEVWRRSELFPGFSRDPKKALAQVTAGKGVLIDIETDLYNYLMQYSHHLHQQMHLGKEPSFLCTNSFQYNIFLSDRIIQEMNSRIVQYSSSNLMEAAERKHYRRIHSNLWTESDSSRYIEAVNPRDVFPVLIIWFAGEALAVLSFLLELFLSKLSRGASINYLIRNNDQN